MISGGKKEEAMKSRCVLLAAIAVGVFFGSASLSLAELFRCQRPDGSIVYTDDQAVCPGATNHEPQGVVQSVPESATPQGQAPAKRIQMMRRALEAETKDAAQWQNKKIDATNELAQLTSHRSVLKRYLNHCSRGGSVYIIKENGLKAMVPCSEVRMEFTDLENRHAELTAYLDGGLQQECHRAGCLPGWVR
jgi:hypothetical protein